MSMYRQGDILLIQTEDGFNTEHPQEDRIVAEGSITGHHHKIVNGNVYRQRRGWSGLIGYVQALPGCKIIHDEHHTIELPEGNYKIIKQREVTGDVED